MENTGYRIRNTVNKNLYCSVLCFLLSVSCLLFLGAGGEHEDLTLKSYFPVFLIQVSGFILLAYVIVRFAFPFIMRAVKDRKHNIENYLQSLDEKIVSHSRKLNELRGQLDNIQKIIQERKRVREQEIDKIAASIEREIEEIKQKVSERIKLEEELEILRLKIFIRDFIKSEVYDYIKKNLTNKQLQDVQKQYEQEFLSKFLLLKQDANFINKLRMV